MKKAFFPVVALLLIFCCLFNCVPVANACGPFTADPIFSYTRHADYPLMSYANGNTGVVPDTFGRISLFTFYRQLNNTPLTKEEQTQVTEATKFRIGTHWGDNSSPNTAKGTATEPLSKTDYVKLWQTARGKILGDEAKISTEKQDADEYDTYYNCLSDAFKNAAGTLESRTSKYGANADVKEWVKGQDAVFSNCGGAGTVPAALPGSSPEWLQKDRQYQIAAALFYQDKNAEARKGLEQIAADSKSVWQKTARFVAARTYIREASFIEDEAQDTAQAPPAANMASNSSQSMSNSVPPQQSPSSKGAEQKKALLQNARTQLRGILTDNSMSDFHASAQRLLNLVEYRSNPEQRLKELGEILAQPSENRNIYNDLIDYVWLLDKIGEEANASGAAIDQAAAEKAGKTDYGYEYTLKLRDVPAKDRDKDLTDWLFTYQSADGYNHAVEKWRATQKTPWLIAALVKADSKSSQISDLVSAADKIPSTSPAYPTAAYHQIRLLLETGKRAEAKKKLDQIFAGNLNTYNISTQNKFVSQRMILATNLDEFLKYAQRHPAAFIWSDDANEEGFDLTAKNSGDSDYNSDDNLRKWSKQTMFDDDAVAYMNEKMPLSVLKQAALSPQLPEYLKKFLVISVWTRAFILKNDAIEREFTPLMSKYAPEYATYFSKYASATTPVNREAAALAVVLRYPIIQPYVPVGYGRGDLAPESIDSLRGNWWCVKAETEEDQSYYDQYNFKHPAVYPDFLTAAQKAEAEREHNQLVASDNSATYLTRRALEFADKNPSFPQTPELLHLSVRSTRYGCKDPETGKFSKQAFDILHNRYASSPWTKQTPYWFH